MISLSHLILILGLSVSQRGRAIVFNKLLLFMTIDRIGIIRLFVATSLVLISKCSSGFKLLFLFFMLVRGSSCFLIDINGHLSYWVYIWFRHEIWESVDTSWNEWALFTWLNQVFIFEVNQSEHRKSIHEVGKAIYWLMYNCIVKIVVIEVVRIRIENEALG